jgi:hypothetical protein
MSDFLPPGSPPPPPPPGPASIPPPPPPPAGVPAGYVAYGQPANVAVTEPRALRAATVAMFWAATAATVVLALIAYHRGDVARDVLDGVSGLKDAKDADDATAAAALFVMAAMLAGAILVCIWSARTAGNARRRDPGNTANPGLAAGSWFIPLGNLVLPFAQLRTAARAGAARLSAAIVVWQAAFIVAFVCAIVQRVRGDISAGDDIGDAPSRLHSQGIVIFVMAVTFAVAAVAAMRAMTEVDRATSR